MCPTWWRRDSDGILVGILREMHHFEDLGLGEGVTIKLILKKWVGKLWTVFIYFRIGSVVVLYEDGNGPSGSGNFFD
jgi:hypothetical protein